ncbi:MAG: methylmalonic aciduria and homocystinuria type D protein [Cyanobacteria bacterium WB6_1B_304]|nr:methylmalonic aciduria and homocystinuria type D protein [Cyanobacteria bacterium WB6_1B_304]
MALIEGLINLFASLMVAGSKTFNQGKIQYSVHTPYQFLDLHCHELLPDWTLPMSSLLIILQNSPVCLTDPITSEYYKPTLRTQFLEIGLAIVHLLKLQRYQVDLFDPATGLPLLSRRGSLRLDDVTVVRSCLGYPTIQFGQCRLIEHPQWQYAVYPSVLVSTASVDVLQMATETILAKE